MAKKSRAARRKIKDKWKSKRWYNLIAPDMFDGKIIGETPADSPDKLIGRVAEVTVQDMTGDFTKMHIKLQLKVHDVRGADAYTHFIGHSTTSDYIRRLTRRKRSRTDTTVSVTTKDDSLVRVKPIAITDRRIQSSRQTAIRKMMAEIVSKEASGKTLSELVRVMISGELSKEISEACKSIQPLQRVEIRKSEVLKMTKMPEIPEPKKAGEEGEERPAEEVVVKEAEVVERPAEEVAEEE